MVYIRIVGRCPAMPKSETGPSTDLAARNSTSALPPIELQNSQNAERPIFRGKTKQATSADQCSLKPVGGIACEFGVRRRCPPDNCSIVAPTAPRILGRYPK